METSDKLFQYCSLFLENDFSSSSSENNSVGNLAVSDSTSIASVLTKSSSSEFNSQLEVWLNEEYCADCGQTLFSKTYRIEGHCQGLKPTSPSSTVNLELPMDYQESTPPQPPFDNSASDYDSSSELRSSDNLKDFACDFDDSNLDLDSSYDSLPPINCSFTDDDKC